MTLVPFLATVQRCLENRMSWNEEARIRCRFSFTCPRLWDRLQPTAEKAVRHCPECDREVHLALTEEDVRRYSGEGRCIAVPVVQPEGEDDPDRSCWLVGMIAPPYDSGHKE